MRHPPPLRGGLAGRRARQRGSARGREPHSQGASPFTITTRYAFGVYEQDGAVARRYYSLAGQLIAMRDSSTGLHYLYGDHLGSISASTNATGGAISSQYFDAWGKRLVGNVSATDRSYTGQYLDDTGLLFYHARYYDPGMGRFVSADSIVPNAGSLTVTPNDAVATAAWGQKGAAANPQELNRYSYAGNNPLINTDPTGHCFGVLAGIDTLTCVVVVVVVLGAGAVVATSPQSGFNPGDYNWSDWSLPGLPAQDTTVREAKETKQTPKEKKNNVPSWAKGEKMRLGETPAQAAERIMNQRYGKGNWKEGPGTEYNEIKKHFEATRPGAGKKPKNTHPQPGNKPGGGKGSGGGGGKSNLK